MKPRTRGTPGVEKSLVGLEGASPHPNAASPFDDGVLPPLLTYPPKNG